MRGLEIGGQVDREGDIAAERDGVQDARLPGDRQSGVRHDSARQAGRGYDATGSVAQHHPGEDGVCPEGCGRDQERGLLALVGEELDRGERADGSSAHARAEDPDRQATTLGREPGIHERHTDCEGGARDAEEEPAEQEQHIGVERHEGDEQHWNDRDRRDQGEHQPAAEPVGQGPDHDPPEGTHQHGDGDEQGHVRLGELTEGTGVLEHRPQRADQRPGPEVHREACRGHGQHHGRRAAPRLFSHLPRLSPTEQ